MLEDLGVATGIDLDALIAAAHLAEEIVGRRLPGQVMRAGPRSFSSVARTPSRGDRDVPWCATCDRFLSPPTVTPEGTCPACGRPVEAGGAHAPGEGPERTLQADGEPADGEPAGEEEVGPVPLHIKILGVTLVVYLSYRFFQGVEWVLHHI